MIDIPAILVANGAAVLMLLILLFSSHRTLHHRFLDDRIFLLMILITILQCIYETVTLCIDGRTEPGMRELSLALNSLLYIHNIAFAFMWTVYADYKLFSDLGRLRRIYPWMAIPALLVMAGAVVNLFTPVFFTVTETNVYTRSGLYLMPFILTYLYLAYGVVLIYRYRNRVGKYLFLPAIIFMIPIVLCSLLQYFFYGLSLVWLGVAIALVSLHINVQNEVSYLDTLSGLFTRQYMNHYLAVETSRSASRPRLAGIMLDIDRFKSINDEFGHLVGDDAILSAGRLLRSAVPANALAVRFAGDEFVVIQMAENDAEVQDTIQRILQATDVFNANSNKPYQINFSVGYSFYNRQGDSVDAFLGRIDAAMYASKRKKLRAHQLPDRRKSRMADERKAADTRDAG